MLQSKWATVAPPSDAPRNTIPPAPSQPEPASGLDAAAATFSPAADDAQPQEPEPPVEDEFTPSGPTEDALFDNVVPTDESMRVRSDDDLFADDFTPAPQPVVQPASPTPVQAPPDRIRTDEARERERARGRGRGRGRGPGRGANRNNGGTTTVAPQTTTSEDSTQPVAPENAPTGPRKESVPSVRGDRHATGGMKKPKLSEQELAEKMAQIHIKNATLTAAHARAEADAASFAHRESEAKQQAAQRQREERRDRQQMMGEREKNRLRKLKAMEGREWDAAKNEDDFSRGGKFDKKGGFAGDKEGYSDGREYLYRGGRGGAKSAAKSSKAPAQRAPHQAEFPPLPGAANVEAKPHTAPGHNDSLKAADPVRSWADQVEGTEP